MNSNESDSVGATQSAPRTPASPIAVIGMGCMFPGAENLSSYWANIKGRVDAITDVPESHWRPDEYFDPDPRAPDRVYARRGGFLSPVELNPLDFGISPHTLEATDSTQLLGLVVAREALRDAGYAGSRPFDRNRVSVILGVTGALELVIPLGARLGHPIWRRALRDAGVDPDTAEDVIERISAGYVPWQENSFPGLLGNVAAGRIANRLDLGGTNCVVDAACASSLAAIHLAALELAAGRCDVAVSGGLDTFNDIFMYMCFSKTPALSPSGHARPFDASSDGTTLGEGLGVLVLKRLEDARRDGDRVYAVIAGIGTSSDGKGSAIYAPTAGGQSKALRAAYELSGISPATVELVEAHGTGTKVGDATEATALGDVYRSFRPHGTWCALGSVKSQIGHTKAAAGVAGLIKTVLALHAKVLPPTIKVERPLDPVAPSKSPFYVNPERRPWLPRASHPRRAAVSAFGFGGSNFHCVLEESGPIKAAPDWDGDAQIIAFSAGSAAELLSAFQAWPADEAAKSWHALRAAAAKSRAAFDASRMFRLVLVAEKGRTDLKKLASSAAALLKQAESRRSTSTPDGAHFGSSAPPGAGAAEGKLAFVFPGQGSQYAGMLRDLVCQFPEALLVLEEADLAFGDGAELEHSGRLSDRIYPPGCFGDDARTAAESALRDTAVAQPAIGAASLAALQVLARFGVEPALCAGHSFGELTALVAAGWIDAASFHRLARLRGQLMAGGDARDATRDRGTMAAIAAPLADVERWVAEESRGSGDGQLVVANRNAPDQAVVSGPTVSVDAFCRRLDARGVKTRRLPVSAAFHSSLVAAASRPFGEALRAIVFTPGRVPVFSNTTARPYPEDPEAARATLSGQLARPVEFAEEVRQLHAAGARTFIEVGPSNKLTGLVSSILAGQPHQAIAIDAASGKSSGILDLAKALAQLAAFGHRVDLTRWDEGYDPASAPPAARPGVTISLTGANYVKPRPPKEPSARAPAPGEMAPRAPIAQAPATLSTAALSPPALSPVALSPVRETVQAPARPVAAPAPPSALPTSAPAPSPATTRLAASSSVPPTQDSLRGVDETLTALLRMQRETADLHRRFLEGQEAAHRSIESLIELQRRAGSPATSFPASPAIAAAIPANSAPGSIAPAVAQESGHRPAVIASSAADRIAGSPPVLASPAPGPVAPPATSGVAQLVLAVVAEKTGYPAEMLTLDMSLDADLGIDSIKRVEIFSALREKLPDAREVTPADLPSLSTLRAIAEFLAPSDGEAPASIAPASPEAAPLILLVVAEKTGYPAEMLTLDMSLDADLGIDSIKRVEIFSALRERLPGAREVTPADLPALGTLRAIADFLGASSSAPAEHAAPVSAAAENDSAAMVLAVVAEKTGYPAEMLTLDMSLDADLGIDSIKRVEIFSALRERLPGAREVTPADLPALGTLRAIASFLAADDTLVPGSTPSPAMPEPLPESPPAPPLHREPALEPPPVESLATERFVLAAAPLEDTPRERLSLAPGSAVWIAVEESGLGRLVAGAFRAAGHTVTVDSFEKLRVAPVPSGLAGLVILFPARRDGGACPLLWNALELLQRAGSALRAAARGGTAVLAGITRLDGAFGLGDEPTLSTPALGGLAGLVKTAAREWPEVHAKAIDLAPALGDTELLADAILSEALTRGPPELGIGRDGRKRRLELGAAPFGTSAPHVPLPGPNDVIVVTGGARGVTAATSLAIAEACRSRFLLLGRSPRPEPEPAWLASLDDEAAIKKAILARSGGSLTPRALADEHRRLASNREMLRVVAGLEAAGSRVSYCSVDVRDREKVRAAIDDARRTLGPVRGIVHGAGVLADRRIEEKTREQLEQVFSTKVDGLEAILDATRTDDLRFVALFSSSTGRFGRVGQADYAAANEALNKLAQAESRRRPSCRVVSLNWGPWEGGMVTPSLRRVFEDEGIALIPLRDGARHAVLELREPPGGGVEVVVLGKSAPRPPEADHRRPERALSFTLELSVERFPFLRSHVMNGRAVVPAALIIEWLAHGALHDNPGLVFQGFDGFRILKGLILGVDDGIRLRVAAAPAETEGSSYRVPVELWSDGSPGGAERPRLHARAVIRLGSQHEPAPRSTVEPPLAPYREPGPVYDGQRLFHGPELQAIERVEGLGEEGIAAFARTSPPPAAWIRQPLRGAWLADPLALDAAFQLLILWSFANRSAGSLPSGVGSYRQFQRAFPRDGVRIAVRITRAGAQTAEAAIDFVSRTGQPVARIEACECVIDASLEAAFARNRLEGAGAV